MIGIVLLFFALKVLEYFLFFGAQNFKEFEVITVTNWAQWFLPLDFNGTFRWCWSGFLIPYSLREQLSPFLLYLILNAVVFILAFKVAWKFFTSLQISLNLPNENLKFGKWWDGVTFASPRGLASLFWAFVASSFYNYFVLAVESRILMFLFFTIYLYWHLFYFLDILVPNKSPSNLKSIIWHLVFSFFLLSFCFEQWLDVIFALNAALILSRFKRGQWSPGQKNYVLITTLYASVWMVSRFLLIGHTSELSVVGGEQSFVMAYSSPWIMLEDVWHNFWKYAHTSLFNPWPFPGLLPLSALSMPPLKLLEEAKLDTFFSEDVIFFNFYFSWYHYVGLTMVFAGVLAYKFIFKKEADKSSWFSFLLLGLCLWLGGSVTHWGIKFKPYLGLPFYFNYKAQTANMGSALLWSLGLFWWQYQKTHHQNSKNVRWNWPLKGQLLVCLLTIFMLVKSLIALKLHSYYDRFNSVKKKPSLDQSLDQSADQSIFNGEVKP